jgi:hypothetical protein
MAAWKEPIRKTKIGDYTFVRDADGVVVDVTPWPNQHGLEMRGVRILLEKIETAGALTLPLDELMQLDTETLLSMRDKMKARTQELEQLVSFRGGLFLVSFERDKKIHVIKGIRELAGVGLRDAKHMADSVEMGKPQLIVPGDFDNRPTPFMLALEDLQRIAKVEWRI